MIGTNLRELEKYIKNVTAADQVMIWNFSVEHEKTESMTQILETNDNVKYSTTSQFSLDYFFRISALSIHSPYKWY